MTIYIRADKTLSVTNESCIQYIRSETIGRHIFEPIEEGINFEKIIVIRTDANEYMLVSLNSFNRWTNTRFSWEKLVVYMTNKFKYWNRLKKVQ